VSEGTATCGSSVACGGDIVGTWGIEASCATPRAADECPQSIVRYSSYNRTGTYDFGASGEVATAQRTRYTLHATVPLSCLGGASCTTYESLLESDLGGVGQTVEADASCRTGGSSCTCEVTASITEMTTGTYEVEGAKLVFSDGLEYDYCVDDGELALASGALELFLVKF
jgi:hypothetical protein